MAGVPRTDAELKALSENDHGPDSNRRWRTVRRDVR